MHSRPTSLRLLCFRRCTDTTTHSSHPNSLIGHTLRRALTYSQRKQRLERADSSRPPSRHLSTFFAADADVFHHRLTISRVIGHRKKRGRLQQCWNVHSSVRLKRFAPV